MTISQCLLGGGGLVPCTLAFIARDSDSCARKGITAGHCDRTADVQRTVIYSEYSDSDGTHGVSKTITGTLRL